MNYKHGRKCKNKAKVKHKRSKFPPFGIHSVEQLYNYTSIVSIETEHVSINTIHNTILTLHNLFHTNS